MRQERPNFADLEVSLARGTGRPPSFFFLPPWDRFAVTDRPTDWQVALRSLFVVVRKGDQGRVGLVHELRHELRPEPDLARGLGGSESDQQGAEGKLAVTNCFEALARAH